MDERCRASSGCTARNGRTVEYLKSDEAKRIFGELFGPWAKTKTKA